MRVVGRAPAAAFLFLPGALTVYLSFAAGGFFAGPPAVAAVVLAAILVIRTTLVRNPFEGITVPVAVASGALGLYAAWTLASATWSDAPARALIEFDRALLYLLALILFGSLRRSAARLPWLLRGTALAIVAVCAAGLVTRVLPDVWPILPNIANHRLSYPLTYWNATGLLAAIGAILCLHLASSEREPRLVRVLGSAALPLLAPTLLLTFSRGAIGAAAAGLLTYIVVARPRALPAGLLATVVPTAVSVVSAYNADLLASAEPTAPAAVAQGHEVAVTVALCIAAALLLRLLLLPLDRLLGAVRLSRRTARSLTAAFAIAAIAAAVVAGARLDVTTRASDQYQRFVKGDNVADTGRVRDRLTDPGNNGRIDQWKVAIDQFERAPLAGSGAGTYELVWAQHRPVGSTVIDGHSLYLEVLAELGVAGLAALAIALATILVGIAARARGEWRHTYAALLAAAVAWLLHAGIDWDWEMPAVTIWLFALGGAALAADVEEQRVLPEPGRTTRLLMALGLMVVAVTPALVGISHVRLEDGVKAFKQGDCVRAIDAGLGSIEALSVRPEPYELLAYCNLRAGAGRLGVRAMETAVRLDRENWALWYGLAVVRGAAGHDPRPAARMAVRLNPLSDFARAGAERFATDNPRLWRKRALTAPLHVQ